MLIKIRIIKFNKSLSWLMKVPFQNYKSNTKIWNKNFNISNKKIKIAHINYKAKSIFINYRTSKNDNKP